MFGWRDSSAARLFFYGSGRMEGWYPRRNRGGGGVINEEELKLGIGPASEIPA